MMASAFNLFRRNSDVVTTCTLKILLNKDEDFTKKTYGLTLMHI